MEEHLILHGPHHRRDISIVMLHSEIANEQTCRLLAAVASFEQQFGRALACFTFGVLPLRMQGYYVV